MASNLGLLIGNALTAFTASKQHKKEQESSEKYKKAMTMMLEHQIEQAQRQEQARRSLGDYMTTPSVPTGPPVSPIPQYSDAPDGLGLEQTGEITPQLQRPMRRPTIPEVIANQQMNLLESGLAPQFQQLDIMSGRSGLAEALRTSGKPPLDLMNSPEGAAAVIQAGGSPDDFMRMMGQRAGGGITTDLQNYQMVARQRAAAGMPEISFEDYQTGIRQNSEVQQAYKTYVAQSIAAGKTPEPLETFAPRYKASIAGAETTAKGSAERLAKQIDDAYRAADGLPIIARGLELLKTVETGGINAVALQASNLFGVTGADEGELSANLGKAVLSQLRSTFGAQFTEAEGRRLAEIEAGFGKSTAANRRLLEQAQKLVVRVAERGIDAAEQSGQKYDATAIRKAMQFTLSEAGDNGWKIVK
jgi:hypothetical protein